MSFAALTSGICLANAGLGAVHGFATSIGGLHNVPHGAVCGTLMAIANKINVRELKRRNIDSPALRKYSVLGQIFLDEKGRNEDYYIDGFIDYLYRLTDELKLPGLKKLGLSETGLKKICLKTDIKNSLKSLTH